MIGSIAFAINEAEKNIGLERKGCLEDD